ncbi:putative iron-only hydrogenase system regulator [Bacteroidales bacterium 6E]|nr:putative iron-only hydrogenase system regulator [Bacteroidales bacterium 6E]
MKENNRRLGFVGIIIEKKEESAQAVNQILHEFSDYIIARTGIPHAKGKVSVITIVVDVTTDELGLLSGRLGNIPGVSVKSGLAKI